MLIHDHLILIQDEDASSHFTVPYQGFLKLWYPTTIGFPTENDHFGVFFGYHHLRKHPYWVLISRNGPALASVGNVREKFPKLSSLSQEPKDIDQEPEP